MLSMDDCAEFEEYALKVGRTCEELRADKVFPVRCRCKPGTSNPHCGGTYIATTTIEKVDIGEGRIVEVQSWKRLTALHDEEIGVYPARFSPSVLREAIAEFEATA